ncbi:patatin-like phospholipase family protein [Thaumasiovibrio subtropicus]|uniref:patatin-like phospholipase family protein n=1 Tax=Thaumasiovibrio subtropicus TaxID=1891207 RepID=UPI00131D52E8|nr:patatin-like phospholipase family protein [Thaumasiovibrio subtropicus]
MRPKVGLVLSGGGAKGAAHIGVLKALEEMQVPVDYVVGASMGAYIGGLYATGMSADEIDLLFQNLDWQRGFVDRVSRAERDNYRKKNEGRYQLSFGLGFDDGRFQMPKGVIQGQTMAYLLRLTVGHLQDFESFDDLAIPYRAVATDMGNLQPVILDSGSLAQSMQASMALQGILAPVEVDGRLLADGGLVNNLPIAIAKEMGADVVIAVDISNDYTDPDDLHSYLKILDQVTNYVVQNNTLLQQSLMSKHDILISPNTQHISVLGFESTDEAYRLGYQATVDKSAALTALSIEPDEYAETRNLQRQYRRDLLAQELVKVDRYVIDNNSFLSDAAVFKKLNLRPNWPVDFQELERGVRRLYAMDRFERVDYHLYEEEGEQVLHLLIREKSWGPNYIDFRFSVEDDFDADTDLSMGTSINLTGLSKHGAEWRNEFELGTSKGIRSIFHYPFDTELPFYLQLEGEYKVAKRSLTSNREDPQLPDVDEFVGAQYESIMGDVGIGYQFLPWMSVQTGLRKIEGNIIVPGSPDIGRTDHKSNQLYAKFDYDTLDDTFWARDGFMLSYQLKLTDDEVTGNGVEGYRGEKTAQFLKTNWVTHTGRHTFRVIGEYTRSHQPIEPAELGGFLNLSGIPRASLIGTKKAFGAMVYHYQLAANDFGLFKAPIYVGGSLERGGVWSSNDTSAVQATLYNAGSVFAGIRTPIGPMILAYGMTEQGYDSFYLVIGNTF